MKKQQPIQKNSINKNEPLKNKKPLKKEVKKFDKRILLWLGIILVTTFISYTPTFNNGLTNWDDDVYVTDNLTVQYPNVEGNLHKLVTENYVSNFHPITMLTYALDAKFAGFTPEGINPRMFHISNVIIHTLNTFLVFWFVFLLFAGIEDRHKTTEQNRKSWKFELAVISSALFGLHTIHVESVAWVAERKDVLYTFFYFLSAIAYLKYLKNTKTAALLLSIILFTCALLSKAMAVSLAVTLFAVDYLYGRTLLNKKVILEKVPYFLIAIFLGIKAVGAQKESGAMAEEQVFAFYERIAFASYGFTHYILKLIYPHKLSAFYSYPDKIGGHLPNEYYLYPLVPILIIALFFFIVKKHKTIAFTILFFVINIFLVLQLVPVGNAIMADRYAYVPSLGFFILIAVGFKSLVKKFPNFFIPASIIIGLYIASMGYVTFDRCKVWKNSLTMWDNVIEQFQNIPAAYNNRGNARKDKADFEGALDDYNHAIALKPDHAKALNNRGIAKKNLAINRNDGKLLDDAIADYDAAIRVNPNYDDAYSNRGNAKRLKRDFAGALKDYDKSIELKPGFYKAYSNRGANKIDMQDFDGAIKDLQTAIDIYPRFVEAYYNMANAYFNKKDYDNSIRCYKQAIELRPNYAEAYANMATAYFQKGDMKGAENCYSQALQITPDNPEIYVNRGGLKYNAKDFNGAIADFSTAIQMNPKNPKPYYIRALAYQELKQKDRACADFQSAAQMQYPGAAQMLAANCH